MRSRHVPVLVFCTLLGAASNGAAQGTARATVSVNAQFAPRTSLRVSSEVLQFDIARPGDPATAAIEFSAGARTPSEGEIVLSVEPLRGLSGPAAPPTLTRRSVYRATGTG